MHFNYDLRHLNAKWRSQDSERRHQRACMASINQSKAIEGDGRPTRFFTVTALRHPWAVIFFPSVDQSNISQAGLAPTGASTNGEL